MADTKLPDTLSQPTALLKPAEPSSQQYDTAPFQEFLSEAQHINLNIDASNPSKTSGADGRFIRLYTLKPISTTEYDSEIVQIVEIKVDGVDGSTVTSLKVKNKGGEIKNYTDDNLLNHVKYAYDSIHNSRGRFKPYYFKDFDSNEVVRYGGKRKTKRRLAKKQRKSRRNKKATRRHR